MVDGRAIEAVITIMTKFRSSINLSQKNKATITLKYDNALLPHLANYTNAINEYILKNMCNVEIEKSL